MEHIIKYIMGIAAKSNVEKRQVGCVITSRSIDNPMETIVAEGYNSEDEHAEVWACRDLVNKASCAGLPDDVMLKAYVSHAPCPDCSKTLAGLGINEVEVVETFMKFDGDKLRFDLVDGTFMLACSKLEPQYGEAFDFSLSTTLKGLLWHYESTYNVVLLEEIVSFVCRTYSHIWEVEEALAKVLTFGARKYKPGNWKKCSDTGRYLAAAHRHLNAIMHGESKDEETGFDHKDHLLTNLMFLFVLGLNIGEEND